MKSGTAMRVLVGLAALAFILPAGCGRKTAPVVPDSPRPEAVKNITAASRDTTAYLSWSIPTRNVEGKAMRAGDIVQFRIYRAEFGKDRRPSRYRRVADVNPGRLMATARVENGTVFWSDGGLKYGHIYGYQVRAVSSRGGASPPSAEVMVTPRVTPAVPKGISARGDDSFNTITWTPVTALADGGTATVVGYNVYRGTDKAVRDEAPLNREPLTAASYKDTAVANDVPYYYSVRSTSSLSAPWKESQDSEVVSATPRDRTPPNKPAGLSAAAGTSKVFLTWNENSERDLAGYHVYRTAKDGGAVRLTDKLLERTTFSDDTATTGAEYSYAVSAVDRSGNESVLSDEQRVHVEAPLAVPAVSAATATSAQDLTPPDRPTGLKAVPGVDRVLLTWDEARKPGVAGYHVLRAMKKGGEYTRLTEKPVASTSYMDQTVVIGETYYYAVMAVSRAGRESVPSEERRVFVENLR